MIDVLKVMTACHQHTHTHTHTHTHRESLDKKDPLLPWKHLYLRRERLTQKYNSYHGNISYVLSLQAPSSVVRPPTVVPAKPVGSSHPSISQPISSSRTQV